MRKKPCSARLRDARLCRKIAKLRFSGGNMKKTLKRILCGALALTMTSSLVLERALRMNAESTLESGRTANVALKNVTGQFDTSALREENFNAQVLESSAPVYETRTVMITLSSAPLIERADGDSVSSYAGSFAGGVAASSIRKEQDAFLSKLSKAGVSYELEGRYDTLINAVALRMNTKHVSSVKNMQGVHSAVITTKYAEPEAVTSNATVVENRTSVYGTGIYDSVAYTTDSESTKDYGKGTVVAILDTGLDYTHNAFLFTPKDYAWSEAEVAQKMGALAAEERTAGLKASDVYVSAKVPFAYDYADNDADVYPSYSNHGTHVAGIIGGYDENGYTDKDGNDVWSDTDNDGVWDADENAIAFRGVVPNAQLVICKVFTDDLDDEDLGGAETKDIVAALEDCVTLGVDVINMSLGTSCGFTTTNDGDDEGEMLNAVYERIKSEGISLVCAASNDYSAGYGGAYGTNLTTNPDSGTVGSPSTFASALSVASINGQQAPYMVGSDADGNQTFAFYEESRDENGKAYDFASQLLGDQESKTFEYVVVPGTGSAANYTRKTQELLKDGNGNSLGRIALVQRGKSTFQEKVEVAMEMGAAAVIVYNNVAGVIRMNLGEIDNPVPSVSIDMDGGIALRDMAGGYNTVGTITISKSTAAGPFMSEFSSWGPTHDLKLKPEITAHGGEITSTVPGGYGEQSGTSMASPNMAGVMALVRNYVDTELSAYVDSLVAASDEKRGVVINRLANQLIMSTATTVYDQAGRAYSPRKQGAGLGSLANVIDNTSAYLSTANAESDFRPKLEIGDDAKRTGKYENMQFSLTNFGTDTLSFHTSQLVLTETVAKDGLAVAEQAYELSPETVAWTITGDGVTVTEKAGVKTVKVEGGKTASISVSIVLSEEDKEYLEQTDKNGRKIFANGMYVEGFLKLVSDDSEKQCDLGIPFLGFYGDWEAANMLDYDAYYLAEAEQDASILEEDKPQAQVWATQPFSSYYNEKYILPMGGYVYLLDENDEKMYTNEAYNAISMYNEEDLEDESNNYMTSTGIKALYAGLLRNARVVKYTLTNAVTGEILKESQVDRVGKAYAGGGSAVPANVELELDPIEEGLLSNGVYRLDFEFFMNKPTYDADGNLLDVIEDDPSTEEIEDVTNSVDNFSFTFTVDYEAPLLEGARVRFYDYKDGSKQKQKIYLDVDVYDNHYAQALMLCYPKTNEEGETVLQLATDYPTPVRNPNKNATTTVSIEITDIYDEWKDLLYIQVDDYALNSCLYKIDIAEANKAMQTPYFWLETNEDRITLDIYETYTITLRGATELNRSNYEWRSLNPTVAQVKNGEIVGLKAGVATIVVSDRNENYKTVTVTVTEEKKSLASVPSLTFSAIKSYTESLVKPSDANAYSVRVNPGQDIPLKITPDPWYYPMNNITFEWVSSDETVARVDENGNVKTLKDGTVSITAFICKDGKVTQYSKSVTLFVEDEFTVSNYTLTDYNGLGYNQGSVEDGTDILVIPTDMNIMYIGEEAFQYNETIRRIVIPASVVEIRERAFENCKALEEVYFVSTQARENENGELTTGAGEKPIDWSDLTLVHERAFYGCKNLKKVDFSNVKTITLAQSAFADCTALSEIVDMRSVGTAYHYAFANCTSLRSVDLTGLHVAGFGVFNGCTGLTSIETDRFTAIGEYMFYGCTGLVNTVVLRTAKIATGAFYGLEYLSGVRFASPSDGGELAFEIGSYAFAGCGKENGSFVVDFGAETIVSIGAYAFENAAIKSSKFTLPKGLRYLDDNAFVGTAVETFVIDDGTDFDGLRLSGGAFENKKVTVANNCTAYQEESGVIYALENGEKTKILFVNANTTGTLDLRGTTVTAIAEYAFAGSGITAVILPEDFDADGLAEGAFAFSSVKSVDFNGVAFTALPDYLFAGSAIENVALPASVLRIDAYAFADSALQNIYNFTHGNETDGFAYELIGILYVGEGAFANTKSLKSISFRDAGWTPETPEEEPETEGDEPADGETPEEEPEEETVLFTSQFADGVFQGSGVREVRLPSFITKEATKDEPAFKALGDATFVGANALQTVKFGKNTNTSGRYTFAGTPIYAITIPKAMTRIEAYAFRDCNNLQTVIGEANLRYVGESAFENCQFLVYIDLRLVEEFGARAFYNALNLTYYEQNDSELAGSIEGSEENDQAQTRAVIGRTLSLDSARIIGDEAFMMTLQAKYTGLYIPKAEYIGYKAFMRGGMSEVVLPLSIRHIGEGAFSGAGNLTSFRFETETTDNGYFAVKDSVLYSLLNEEKTAFELLCYPAAKVGGENGEYKIEDGTVRVAAYACYGLKSGVVSRFILPYSLKSIGDRAFHSNSVKSFTFESIQAPALESLYEADIRQFIEDKADENTAAYYKGFYYANFDTRFYYFTEYAGWQNYLSMDYPENGVGYDNIIYRTYFGTKNTTGIQMTDDTRSCRQLIQGLESAETVKSWLAWEVNATNTALVKAFSETVKKARAYYNNVSKDAQQLQFVTAEEMQKLVEVETQLRAVKKVFKIPVSVVKVEYVTGSAREQYNVGEKFDMAGVVVNVVYDDGSIVKADKNSLTLKSTEPFESYDNEVEIEYKEGSVKKTAYVVIKVIDPNKPSNQIEPQEVTDETLGITLTLIGAAAVLLGGGLIGLTYYKKRKAALGVALGDTTEETVQNSTNDEESSKQ